MLFASEKKNLSSLEKCKAGIEYHMRLKRFDGTFIRTTPSAGTNLLATITLKGEFRILKLELVMGVAEVGNFAVFCHGVWVKFVWGFEKENFEKNVFVGRPQEI